MCSSFPARLMEKFQASKVYLQLATWRTGKFPSRRISRHLWPVWVRPKDTGQNSDLQWGAEGGIETWVWPKGEFIPSGGGEVSGKKLMPDILHIKSQQTPTVKVFQATLSIHRLITSSKSPSQQKLAWRTDILRNRSMGTPDAFYGCEKFQSTFWFSYLFLF